MGRPSDAHLLVVEDAHHEDNRTLRDKCDLASRVFWLLASALMLKVHEAHGEAALGGLWTDVLLSEQADRYLDGMQKLGIQDDPPAVRAAKYHYFSNILGGATLDYVEESDRKVWIRYTGAYGVYPGLSHVAVTPTLRRHYVMSAWHPNNGVLIGNPRLGWTLTKSRNEGDPYDEGYFYEADRDLSPGEKVRYEVVDVTPECTVASRPMLDVGQWPEGRRLKALRRYASDYFVQTAEALLKRYGTLEAGALATTAIRITAVQYAEDLVEELGGGADDADHERVIRTISTILEAIDQPFSVEPTARGARILIEPVGPWGGLHGSMRTALFEFPSMVARMISGRIAVTRDVDGDAGERWTIEGVDRWLW